MIVDASVAVKWVLREDGSDDALALLARGDLRAPDFVLVEVANVLWKSWRRGVLDQPAVEEALTAVPKLFAQLDSTIPLLPAAARLACELDHPVYDCLYLASALGNGDRLVTDDMRLLRRLESTPYGAVAYSLSRG
ncbi:type II toxin-antitoxin system VapC family toxin [Novosphingobium aquimarinum]|uniref:type II toxin-antitoxin system VapC family toxin n=1 Tax=Novosphingobium aquimarinum TaxID=2682494 RepID=UPI0012EBE3E8|nr:type II toxin-antitoxin system VapC family toxin [Novosphingobium aquimarinum]